jgi:hypothetical protein
MRLQHLSADGPRYESCSPDKRHLTLMPVFILPFPAIDPVAISVGPFIVRWYALAYIFGFFGCWAYASALLRKDRQSLRARERNWNFGRYGRPPVTRAAVQVYDTASRMGWRRAASPRRKRSERSDSCQ